VVIILMRGVVTSVMRSFDRSSLNLAVRFFARKGESQHLVKLRSVDDDDSWEVPMTQL
jgi:hypothetical protein